MERILGSHSRQTLIPEKNLANRITDRREHLANRQRTTSQTLNEIDKSHRSQTHSVANRLQRTLANSQRKEADRRADRGRQRTWTPKILFSVPLAYVDSRRDFGVYFLRPVFSGISQTRNFWVIVWVLNDMLLLSPFEVFSMELILREIDCQNNLFNFMFLPPLFKKFATMNRRSIPPSRFYLESYP